MIISIIKSKEYLCFASVIIEWRSLFQRQPKPVKCMTFSGILVGRLSQPPTLLLPWSSNQPGLIRFVLNRAFQNSGSSPEISARKTRTTLVCVAGFPIELIDLIPRSAAHRCQPCKRHHHRCLPLALLSASFLPVVSQWLTYRLKFHHDVPTTDL
jgi:hypothetical protein